MCSMSVLCPLCTQSSFTSIDALRLNLIRAANGPLPCPICNEILLGLDKLTIHLFSHTNILTTTKATTTTTTAATAKATTHSDEMKIISLPEKVHNEDGANVALPLQAPHIISGAIAIGFTTDNRAQPEGSVNEKAADASQKLINDWSLTRSTCDICEFNYRTPDLLELHYRLVHENATATPTTEKNKPEQQVRDEPPTPLPLPLPPPTSSKKEHHHFKCHLCAKTFKMKGSLRVHLKVVHLIGLPTLATNAANVPAKFNLCERIRLQKEHRETVTATKNTTIVIEMNSPQQDGGLSSFAVDVAQQPPVPLAPLLAIGVQSNGNAVMNTLPSDNEPLMEIMPPTVDHHHQQQQQQSELEKSVQNSIRSENTKIWDCDVCAKSFTTKYFLKKHKRLHTGEMPYTCEICARTFTFQQSYHKHLLYHSDEKPHVCTTCGRAFKELSTLHNHERIHSGEKPFKCEVCDKSFRQRVSFLVHTRIHTGVMPYRCDICLRSFRYKVSQRTHKCVPPNVAVETRMLMPPQCNTAGGNESEDQQISESFIKAFLESTAAAAALLESRSSPNSVEIAIINSTDLDNLRNSSGKNDMDEEAILSQTIDDIVVESCNKLGIGSDNMQVPPSSVGNGIRDAGVWSVEGNNPALLKFEKMRLYSPEMMQQEQQQQRQQQMQHPVVGAEVEDFAQFLIDEENVL